MDILNSLVMFVSGADSPMLAYGAVFLVLLICGFGVPIPEDITLVAGGVLAGLGYANFEMMVVVGLLGVMVGDSCMFCAGHFMEERVRRNRLINKLLTPERYERTQDLFHRYGNFVLFIARFLPGLRTPIFVTAGMTKRISFWRFFCMDGFAALISVPVWVWVGFYFAQEHERLLEWVKNGQRFVLFGIAVMLVVLVCWYFKRRKKA
jgi:membrane protein DedA with SNARE-associated domain